MLASHLLVVLPLLLHTHAFQFPFRIPFLTTQPKPSSEPVPHPPPRVAIIGAGPSGSSAAFWLSLAKQRYGLDDLEIDVFEKSSYIGGRSTVAYPYDNHDLPAVELGASVFVGSNKNLWRAADEFNLTRIPFKSKAAEGFGMWDGSNVIFAVLPIQTARPIQAPILILFPHLGNQLMVGLSEDDLEVWVQGSQTHRYTVRSILFSFQAFI